MKPEMQHDRAGTNRAEARLVVGFDAGISARRALDFAIGVTQRIAGSLVCVYVERGQTPLTGLGSATVGPDLVLAHLDAERSQLAIVMSEVAEARRRSGLPIQLVVLRSPRAAAGIEWVAREIAADQVIVGSPARARRFGQDVAKALQRLAACPITIVP